jgi:hypothetical protein
LWRVRFSRWLARRILGRDVMLSALAEWHRHPARHAINALFFDRDHCSRVADWEAYAAREAEDEDERFRRVMEP